MAVYTYTAKGPDGKKTEGVIKAADKNAATAELKKKNLSVSSMSEQKGGKKSYGIFGPPRPHVKTKDIAVLTRQLSTMISAGIPLLESMEILHEQASDPGFKNVLDKVIERVRAGSDFSTALSEHKLFTRIYINMIKAGEASGQLDVILQRLADYMENIEELKREIKAAMTYPVISLLLILGITIGLIVGIVPKFQEIFKSLEMKALPAPTEILLAVSDALRNHYIAVLGVAIVLVIAFLMYIKTKIGLKQWHWFCLHAPVFGPLFRKVAISRFSRTFSTLISSGVPMLGALDIVASTAGNIWVEEAVLRAKEAVSRGETLGDPLAASKVFPPMVTRMVSIGEKTGALEKLLMKISEFYDSEVRAMVKSLTSLIEPLLIATMGIIVGFIVLAIFLPIIKIQQSLTK